MVLNIMWKNDSKVPPQSNHYVVGKGRIPAVDISSLKCILPFSIIIIFINIFLIFKISHLSVLKFYFYLF
jgi:hypothetical protein